MPDNIDSISPNFRDILLNRNLIPSDTVNDNGLGGLMAGLGQPGKIETPPNAVQDSIDIEEDGELYRELNVINNPYQNFDAYTDTDINTNTVVNIGNLPNGATPTAYGPNLTNNNEIHNVPIDTAPFNGNTPLTFWASKNLYNDEQQKYKVNLNTNPILTTKQKGAYLDENGSLNLGGPSTQAFDLIGSVLNGQGIGVTNNGLEPGFDVRTSIAGRGLASAGLIEDTNLGKIGGDQLLLHLGYNAAFGLQQETIGHVNLNPLSLASGNDFIVPNYTITVPSGTLGGAFDFISRVFGFESPVSLFGDASSIFQDENPVGNIDRANAQIANTGKGQVLALFNNILANQSTTLRNRYRPAFADSRAQQGANQTEGINSDLYAGDVGNGTVVDFLNPKDDTASPTRMSRTAMQPDVLSAEFEDLGSAVSNVYIRDVGQKGISFVWTDDNLNKKGRDLDAYNGSEFSNKKGLLEKTQEIFNTNKMRTLVSGKGDGTAKLGEIQTGLATVGSSKFMSKGSGVVSQNVARGFITDTAFEIDGEVLIPPATPEDVFCRAWTTFDRYNQVQDLQKHRSLDPNAGIRRTVEGTVLDDNGFVRIAPKNDDITELGAGLVASNIKRFMFSIENLAWADSLTSLVPCEVGPGDTLTGRRGRIMWFPPYEMNFTDNTSVSWDRSEFIGRGEPIYTYNNTERTGTLQWKIIIDHPNYLNEIRRESDAYITSFFAGCNELDDRVSSKLTADEKNKMEVAKAVKPETKESPKVSLPQGFTVYFSNDSNDIPETYENGRIGDNTSPLISSVTDDATGKGYGEGTTVSDGHTNKSGTTFPDNFNYGLNRDFYENWLYDSTGALNPSEAPEMIKWAEQCDSCRAIVKGYASIQGNTESNRDLAADRASIVASWLEGGLRQALINADKADKADNVDIMVKDEVPDNFELETKTENGEPCIAGRGVGVHQDKKCLKVARKATVTFEENPNLQDEVKADAVEGNAENTTSTTEPNAQIKSRFYCENTYFQKLKQDDKFIYDSIGNKIQYFHPAFHSITPEGFNSRLTFLQQCTRQGPTKSGDADNLAFGRAPVCILRVGDFYHTKIIIENISLAFDPLVWDLNPEGVGVQPMICTVDMTFAFIGGQSLQGPINKLQNAVSFNFFANTEIYEERSDTIKINGTTGTLVKGNLPSAVEKNAENIVEGELGELVRGLGSDLPEVAKDDVARAETEAVKAEKQEVRDIHHVKVNLKLNHLELTKNKRNIQFAIATRDDSTYDDDYIIILQTKEDIGLPNKGKLGEVILPAGGNSTNTTFRKAIPRDLAKDIKKNGTTLRLKIMIKDKNDKIEPTSYVLIEL